MQADVLAIPVFEESKLGPGAVEVNKALDGKLAEFIEEADFKAKLGEQLAVPTYGALAATSVVIVGLGKRDELDLAGFRRVCAAVAKRTAKATTVATTVLDALPKSVARKDGAQALATGFVLGAYKFTRYKAEEADTGPENILICGRTSTSVEEALDRGQIIADAVCGGR